MLAQAICTVLILTCVTADTANVSQNHVSRFEEISPQQPWDSWWDEDWVYRARVFIDNQYNNEILTEFPIPIQVPYRPGMRPDFSDIRFTDVYGSFPLPYWIEEYERTSGATIWVRVPEIPAAANIYIYYGNPDAPSESDLDAYVELYEPFVEDPTLAGDWSVYRHAGNGSLEGCWDPSNEVFYLTRRGCDLGVAAFTAVDLNQLNGWSLVFEYLVGGGSGGEGFTTMFFKDETSYTEAVPSCGNGLGFTTADGGEIPGFGVEFDARQGGENLSKRHVALIENHVDNHLTHAYDARVSDGVWHSVELVYYQGDVNLTLDSDTLFEYNLGNTRDGFGYGGLGFSAATGEFTNDHIIDNVMLRKWTDPMPASLVGDEESLIQTVVETSFGYIKSLYR